MTQACGSAPACAFTSHGRPLGAAPTLVLAHSVGTNGGMWALQQSALGADHHLLILDLPGHGAACVPSRPCTLKSLTHAVLDAITRAGVARFRFCGISLGGQIGLSVALVAPARVEALVVSNSAARIGSAELWSARIEAVQTSGMAGICDATFARWFSPTFAARHPVLHAQLRRSFLGMDPAGYIACCEALGAADLRAEVRDVAAPTLVLTGGLDAPTPPDEARWLHAQIRGSELAILEGAAHLANLDRAEVFTDRVRAFLRDLDRASRR